MAPPRMGKTWLVRNLAFVRAKNEGWNVGYAESSGGKNDLMREAVTDLYKGWLDGNLSKSKPKRMGKPASELRFLAGC